MRGLRTPVSGSVLRHNCPDLPEIGKLAIPGVCENDPRGNAVYTEVLRKGTVPTEVCDHHVQLTVCSESGGLATEYCPEKNTRTFMVIPDGESGGTDDSRYRSPGTCTIHSSTLRCSSERRRH
ncbi:MAG: hypothetical protein ACLUAR_17435 [Pilosibacter sp.]